MINDFFKPLNWFREKYIGKISDRYYTFKVALNLFIQRRGEVIVETGCMREPDDWGAGASTLIFGETLSKYGGRLYTIDNNGQHLERAKQYTKNYVGNISYILGDSVAELTRFDRRIDLLYLDSLDFPLPQDFTEPDDYKKQIILAQEHNFKEIQAAWNKLHRDSIILLDDYDFPEDGKPKQTIKFLQEHGWKVVLEGQQILLIT